MKAILLAACILKTLAPFCQQYTLEELQLNPVLVKNCTPVKDQHNSSTCWSFSSNSFLESEVYHIKKEKLDLSEMFVARNSYIRKVETYLRNKGGNFFTPGGQFHDVVWVLKNYGMVPEEVYTGRPGGKAYHDHAELDTAIRIYVNLLLQQGITQPGKKEYAYLDSVLDHHLGKLPGSFFFKGKKYDAKSFLKEYLKINPDDFIEITSYTHHPFYTRFVLEDKYNWTADSYYNVPVSDLISITDHALKNNRTIGWDGDVDEPGFNFYGGIAYLPGPVADLQKERQTTFNDSSTSIDHMMHIVAVTKDKFGEPWYYVKNSWGDFTNTLHGFLFMSSGFFAVKTGAIIVNKNIITPSLRRKMHL
jgi:bleomycin hydrolase